MKFELGKTLESVITRWWEDIHEVHTDWSTETAIDDLCDRIYLWLPKEQNADNSQRMETVIAVDTHNKLLQKIKSKLRSKK